MGCPARAAASRAGPNWLATPVNEPRQAVTDRTCDHEPGDPVFAQRPADRPVSLAVVALTEVGCLVHVVGQVGGDATHGLLGLAVGVPCGPANLVDDAFRLSLRIAGEITHS